MVSVPVFSLDFLHFSERLRHHKVENRFSSSKIIVRRLKYPIIFEDIQFLNVSLSFVTYFIDVDEYRYFLKLKYLSSRLRLLLQFEICISTLNSIIYLSPCGSLEDLSDPNKGSS